MIALATFALAVHTFCWDVSSLATGYRLYWSSDPAVWVSAQRAETGELCITDPTPDPVPGEIVYYLVTAYNSAGESDTEHGQII